MARKVALINRSFACFWNQRCLSLTSCLKMLEDPTALPMVLVQTLLVSSSIAQLVVITIEMTVHFVKEATISCYSIAP